jgi:hypothetical protein
MRPLAWTLIVLVTAFWLWFGIASAAAERLGGINWLGHIVVPGGVLVVTALIAWRWPVAGAALLIAEGLFVAVGYPLTFGRRFPVFTTVMVLLTMAARRLAGVAAAARSAHRVAQPERRRALSRTTVGSRFQSRIVSQTRNVWVQRRPAGIPRTGTKRSRRA